MRIEISINRLDPPEGVAARVPRRADGPTGDPQAFVGWLGLLGVLQSLMGEPVDQPPP